MQEERIVWTSVLDQPVHGPENVLLGRLAHGILLIVCEDDHVFPLVAKVLDEVGRHVAHVVDAASKLATLAKIVDANQQAFPPAITLRVLKVVVLWVAIAKALGR